MAVFSEPPVLKVMAGRTELGSVPQQILTLEAPDGHRLLLGGRNWYVKSIDWRRGVVYVEPAPDGGRARWLGDGQALSWELCQAMRRILAGTDLQRVRLSERASGRMEMMREEFGWVRSDPETVIVRSDGQPLWWWTFAGMKANLWLAGSLGDLIDQTAPDDFRIRLAPSATPEQLQERLEKLDLGALRLGLTVADAAVDRLKFAEALPDADAREVVEARLRDDRAVRAVAEARLRVARR